MRALTEITRPVTCVTVTAQRLLFSTAWQSGAISNSHPTHHNLALFIVGFRIAPIHTVFNMQSSQKTSLWLWLYLEVRVGVLGAPFSQLFKMSRSLLNIAVWTDN